MFVTLWYIIKILLDMDKFVSSRELQGMKPYNPNHSGQQYQLVFDPFFKTSSPNIYQMMSIFFVLKTLLKMKTQSIGGRHNGFLSFSLQVSIDGILFRKLFRLTVRKIVI